MWGPESERHVALDAPSFNKIPWMSSWMGLKVFEGLPHPDEQDCDAKTNIYIYICLWREIWELSWKSLWFLI